jgi:acylphosphatase
MLCSGNDALIAKHLRISGWVQGVGYRDWLVTRARGLGLSGWVRNRSDGSVEALIGGDARMVDECVRACWGGPRLAAVDQVTETLAAAPEAPGFAVRPTL